MALNYWSICISQPSSSTLISSNLGLSSTPWALLLCPCTHHLPLGMSLSVWQDPPLSLQAAHKSDSVQNLLPPPGKGEEFHAL